MKKTCVKKGLTVSGFCSEYCSTASQSLYSIPSAMLFLSSVVIFIFDLQSR